MEETLVIVKPDGVRKKIIGEVISRLERKGLEIVKIRELTFTRELAEKHYAEHRGKDFYERLVNFITSGPSVVMVVRGENAIEKVRTLAGPTDPLKAPPGTIRGDFGEGLPANVIHASDSPTSADREIKLFFPDEG